MTTAGSYDVSVEPERTAPPRSENRARSQVVTVRIDEDERERWTAFAQRKGMPLAGFLRLAAESAIVMDEIAEAHRG